MKEFNVIKSIKAQKELCDKNGYPHFAPENGICYNCNRYIYLPYDEKKEIGVSVEKATTELITSCPHCHISYCE